MCAAGVVTMGGLTFPSFYVYTVGEIRKYRNRSVEFDSHRLVVVVFLIYLLFSVSINIIMVIVIFHVFSFDFTICADCFVTLHRWTMLIYS